jgi:hypothetical protein
MCKLLKFQRIEDELEATDDEAEQEVVFKT